MPRYAAVDIGSNSVRMEVAEITAPPRAAPRQRTGAAMTVLASDREVTRLGEGVFREGRLSPDAAAKTYEVLDRMAKTCQKHDVSGMRVVATSAVRDARNQDQFLARASAAIGAPVEVISGAEEARLVHLGVQWRWPHPEQRILILDIGGGSAEVILGESGRLVEGVSRPLGAVRLRELFLRNDPPTRADLQRLDEYIAEKISGAVRRIGAQPVDRVIATAATASAVVCAVNRVPRKDRERADRLRATAAQIRRLYEAVATRPLEERRKLTGIGPRRAEIIVPGVALLRRALTDFRQHALYYSAAGVRDGIAVDLYLRGVGRELSLLDREPRVVVEQMARRYNVLLPHARNVAHLANELFIGLESAHRLPRSCGKLLEAAALLMDSGHFISDSRHHRHSYYIVSQSALPGFTDAERQVIANLCRYHRKSLPTSLHPGYLGLGAEQKRWVWLLSPILRLADALDRSRKQPVKSVGCGVREGALEVRLRASAGIDLEVWAAERIAPSFREVYALRLTIAREST